MHILCIENTGQATVSPRGFSTSGLVFFALWALWLCGRLEVENQRPVYLFLASMHRSANPPESRFHMWKNAMIHTRGRLSAS
jgi:hypothetical protein